MSLRKLDHETRTLLDILLPNYVISPPEILSNHPFSRLHDVTSRKKFRNIKVEDKLIHKQTMILTKLLVDHLKPFKREFDVKDYSNSTISQLRNNNKVKTPVYENKINCIQKTKPVNQPVFLEKQCSSIKIPFNHKINKPRATLNVSEPIRKLKFTDKKLPETSSDSEIKDSGRESLDVSTHEETMEKITKKKERKMTADARCSQKGHKSVQYKLKKVKRQKPDWNPFFVNLDHSFRHEQPTCKLTNNLRSSKGSSKAKYKKRTNHVECMEEKFDLDQKKADLIESITVVSSLR